jgi:tetratricopeptide (TPR) repeat protein
MNEPNKILWILILTLCTSGVAIGQSTVFSLFKSPLELANENFSQGNYATAIELYKTALAKRPEDIGAQLKLAQAYYQLKDYETSVSFYNSYLSHENKELSFADMLKYADAKVALKDHSSALTYYKRCLQRDPDNDVIAKKIWRIDNINYLFEDSSRFAVKELAINSPAGELAPVVVHDGLIFTSNRKISRAIEESMQNSMNRSTNCIKRHGKLRLVQA